MAGAPARGAIEAAHAAMSDAICSCRIDNFSSLHNLAPPPKIVVTVARVLDVMPTSLERDDTSPHCDTPLPIRVKVTVADTGQGVPVTTLVEHYNQLFRTLCKPEPSDVHLRKFQIVLQSDRHGDPLFVMTTAASDILVRAYEMRTADLPSEGALVILQCPCIEKTQETRLSGTTLSFEAEGRIEELLVFIHDQFNAVGEILTYCLYIGRPATATFLNSHIIHSARVVIGLQCGRGSQQYAYSYDMFHPCQLSLALFVNFGAIQRRRAIAFDQEIGKVTMYKDGCLTTDSSCIIQALEHGVDWSRYGLDYERAFISSPGRANMTFKHAGLTGKRLEIFVHEIGAYPGQMHASAARTSSEAAYYDDASQSRLVKAAVQKALDKSKLRGPSLLQSTSQKKVLFSNAFRS
eukprot:SM000035S13059  [mRNA]  locus=s35:123540:126410:- [translate_table: standard]